MHTSNPSEYASGRAAVYVASCLAVYATGCVTCNVISCAATYATNCAIYTASYSFNALKSEEIQAKIVRYGLSLLENLEDYILLTQNKKEKEII